MDFKLRNFTDCITNSQYTTTEQYQILLDGAPFALESTDIIMILVSQNGIICYKGEIDTILDAEKGVFGFKPKLSAGMYDVQLLLDRNTATYMIPSHGKAGLYVAESLVDELPELSLDQYTLLAEVDASIKENIAGIENILTTKSNIGHTHTINDTVGLEDALNAKAPISHKHDEYLTEHQDISHLASKSQLQTSLNSKADATHSHDEFSTLNSKIDAKAEKNHTHSDFSSINNQLNSLQEKDARLMAKDDEIESKVSLLRFDLDNLTVSGGYEFSVVSEEDVENMWKKALKGSEQQ